MPERFDTFEKYRKKAMKMRPNLELELEERNQVDNVLNFFNMSQKDEGFLNDDEFYKPMAAPAQPVEASTTEEESKSEVSFQQSQMSRLEPEDNFS